MIFLPSDGRKVHAISFTIVPPHEPLRVAEHDSNRIVCILIADGNQNVLLNIGRTASEALVSIDYYWSNILTPIMLYGMEEVWIRRSPSDSSTDSKCNIQLVSYGN